MRAVFRAVARAMAALAAAALVLVSEGGKMVWRSLRAIYGAPEPDVDEAVEAADAVIPEQELTPAAASQDAEWGAAALAHLCGEPGADGVLDEAALEYLDALDADQRGRLAGYPTSRIGQHILATRPITSLPVAPTLAEWRAEQWRAQGEAGEASRRRIAAQEEHARIVQEVFDDLLADDKPLAA